jgi:lysophospholipase L1-like esterase
MKIWKQASGIPGTAITTANVASGNAAVNDVLRLTYSQRAAVITLNIENLTQGTTNSLIATSPLDGNTALFQPPNVGRFRVCVIAGTYDLINLSLISQQMLRQQVACFGDSKTAGLSALSDAARWGNLIGPHFSGINVIGGSGDYTATKLTEMSYLLSLQPRNVILNIGRNDLKYGIASATWQANYASIVSQLQTAGINVVHLMPIPETQQDQTALTSFINTTYPSANKIDVTSAWVNATDLSADTIHPNPAGHTLIANTITANLSMFV